MLWIRNVDTRAVAGGDRRQPGDPHIHPGLPVDPRQRRGWHVDDETRVGVPGRFTNDRDRTRFRRHRARPPHSHLAYLREEQLTIAPHAEAVAGEPKRL